MNASTYARTSHAARRAAGGAGGEAAVFGLQAAAGNGTTTLTWGETGPVDSVNIYRDGLLADTIAGGVGSWTSPILADGLYAWHAAPVTGGVEGTPTAPITFGCMTGDVWVDPVSGSDANDGSSPAQAVKTLNRAGSLVSAAGMRVVIRGGTYNEYNSRITSSDLGNPPLTTFTQDGTESEPCELRSFPGEKVVIDGSGIQRPLPTTDPEVPELLCIAGDWWVVSGWPGPPDDPLAFAIELRDSAGGGFRTRLTVGVKAFWVDSHGHEGSAFNMQEADDWEVAFCRGWDVYSASNDGETADGIACANGHRGHVHHNVFAFCGDDGIDIILGHDMLVENNVVYRSGFFTDGSAGLGNGNGIKMGGPSGTVHDAVVRNNLVVGCRASGLTANEGWGILCAQNTAIGNLRGFAGREGGSSVVFTGNVEFGNTNGNLIDDGDGEKPTETWNSWNTPPGVTVDASDFENLVFDESWASVDQVIDAGYALLAAGSDLVGAGEQGQDLGWEGGATLPAPTLTLTPGDQQIAAAWTAVPGATVYRHRINGGAWTETTSTSHVYTGLTNDQTYTVDVQAGDGAVWSASATKQATPQSSIPAIGAAAFGGFMAGVIDTTQGNIDAADAYQTGQRYLLIVSPKSLEATLDTPRRWSSTPGNLPGAKTRWDGLSATQAMLAAGGAYEAAAYVDALSFPSDGGSQWYLPALDELELLHRNLKPGTVDNATSSETTDFPGTQQFGVNPSSDPPGAAYTAGDPPQTGVAAFQTGGAEELGATLVSSTWGSTAVMWVQDARDGWQFPVSQDVATSAILIRPVRRVPIP